MNLKSSMKKQVFTIQDTEDIGAAARKFIKHHVGMLPVIDGEGKLVGVLQLRDILSLAMPVFTKLMEDFDFVGSFGAADSIQPSKEEIDKKVSEVMEPPVYVEVISGLSRAFALLHQHNLTDLPVVDEENRLLGIASRVDIGTAILKRWKAISGN